MKYALNLAPDGRFLSATRPRYAPEDAVIVDALPDGDAYQYRYVDGKFVYDPIPEPEAAVPAPTAQDDTDEMLVDIQYRLTLMELGIEE